MTRFQATYAADLAVTDFNIYAYDEQGHLVGEYDAYGAPIQETVYLGDTPVAVLQGASLYFLYSDHLNTPRVITNTTNKVIWNWSSEPFGSTAANEDPDGDGVKFTYNLRFPGQYYDRETGLHYNYFRDYDPRIGRYVESDPIGLGGGINTYTYVGGNPLIGIDPIGLFCASDFIYHYFFGGGTPIDLGAVGLLGAFQNSASVSGSVNSFKNAVRVAATAKAKSSCRDCDKGTKTTTFNLNDKDTTDVTNEPCLYSVGHSTFFRSAKCSVTTNCTNKTYSFACSLGFSIRDVFKRPIGEDRPEIPGGTPYPITGGWSDSISGGGQF